MINKQSTQNIIDQVIAGIAAVAEDMPGVVIIHNLKDRSIAYISDRGLTELGVARKEVINTNMEVFHDRFFNPDDAKDYTPKIISFLERNNNDEVLTFFQQVRFNRQKNWTWHMSSVKILERDHEGRPLLTITMSFPIDAMHHMTAKASRLLEENNFLRSNLHIFAKLSKREREVLKLLALGKTSAEIAEQLFIALMTVETHRKNIKQKLNASSNYEINQYARAFDLI